MNKKLVVLAVGAAVGALAAPAFAQSSTVTLSGNLNYAYGYVDGGGAGFTTTTTGANFAAANAGLAARNTGPRQRYDSIINQESEWVVAGQENLGGGMAAFFKCSSSFDITGAGASTMCARNSVIGLKGSWGQVSWGNNDTPIKTMIAMYDPFPISAAYGQGGQMFNQTASALGNGESGSGGAASFSRRQKNLITYQMPTMNGFDAAVAISAANEAAGVSSQATIQKPRMWSVMANYTNGPLMLGAGYERHKDYNPGCYAATSLATTAPYTAAQVYACPQNYQGGQDSSYQLGASYTFMGSLKISAIYVNMKYDNIDGAGRDMAVNTYGLYGDWAVSGPHRIKFGYGVQGATKGTYAGGNVVLATTGAVLTSDTQTSNSLVGGLNANAGAGQTGSQKLQFEYAYALSKRTDVALNYARISNDRNSNMSIGSGGPNYANYGETQTWAGMRIGHKF